MWNWAELPKSRVSWQDLHADPLLIRVRATTRLHRADARQAVREYGSVSRKPGLPEPRQDLQKTATMPQKTGEILEKSTLQLFNFERFEKILKFWVDF